MGIFADGINSIKQLVFESGKPKESVEKQTEDESLFKNAIHEILDIDKITDEFSDLMEKLGLVPPEETEEKVETEKTEEAEKAETSDNKYDKIKEDGIHTLEYAINDLGLSEEGQAIAQGLFHDLTSVNDMLSVDKILTRLELLVAQEKKSGSIEFEYAIDSARVDIGYSSEINSLYEQYTQANNDETRQKLNAQIQSLVAEYQKEKNIVELQNMFGAKIDELSIKNAISVNPEAKAEMAELIDKLQTAKNKDEVERIFAEIQKLYQENVMQDDIKFEYELEEFKLGIGYSAEIATLYEELSYVKNDDIRNKIKAEILQLDTNYSFELAKVKMEKFHERLEGIENKLFSFNKQDDKKPEKLEFKFT